MEVVLYTQLFCSARVPSTIQKNSMLLGPFMCCVACFNPGNLIHLWDFYFDGNQLVKMPEKFPPLLNGIKDRPSGHS